MNQNSFLNNLFGVIAGGSSIPWLSGRTDFIPNGSNGQTISLKLNDVNAIWLGLESRVQQLYAYEYCYAVAAVVDRLAELDLTSKVEIIRAGGKGKDKLLTSTWAVNLNRLFEQPNPLQSWEQFRGQQLVYKRVFGFCPVFPVIPAGFENSPDNAIALINLPPWLFDVVPTYKLLYQTNIRDIVAKYTVNLLGSVFSFRPDEIFILTDSFHQDQRAHFLLPKSRLVGLDMAISNICAAMEADNVLLKKKGPLGFISHDAAAVKDSVAGYLPMQKSEKKELQNALQKYGMSWNQLQYVISRQAVKWNPMSFDVKGLGTKETVIAGEKAICHRYGYPYVLYEQIDATYANGSEANKVVYESVIQPNANKDYGVYNKFFKAAENNGTIEADFGHISALQEDEKYKGQGAAAMDTALQIEWLNNVITLNQWRDVRGIERTIDGDVYYKDIQQQQAEAVAKLNTQPANENAA